MSETKTAVARTTKSNSARKKGIPAPANRCTHKDAAGRQCRNLALRSTGSRGDRGNSGLCVTHATEERQLHETEAVAEELLANTEGLHTTVAVNNVLARLFDLTANDRIPMRKAALLTYQASLLLYTVPGVKDETLTLCKPEAWRYMIQRTFEAITGKSAPDDSSDEEPAIEHTEEEDQAIETSVQ
ncbi:MAG TPA: hypothetical protein VGZ48_06695 [Candidatus Acidoferrales bacterium]|jgi:hypothetical protein|nr:hypothetical protein [Candidatus Acidoferrales bacterium]